MSHCISPNPGHRDTADLADHAVDAIRLTGFEFWGEVRPSVVHSRCYCLHSQTPHRLDRDRSTIGRNQSVERVVRGFQSSDTFDHVEIVVKGVQVFDALSLHVRDESRVTERDTLVSFG